MVVVVICSALVLAGLAAVLRWGGLSLEPPAQPEEQAGDVPTVRRVVRVYIWYLTVGTIAGLAAGILAAGAGGRLAMRLLAVTAGADAQGRITEAEEIVGRITANGTLSFIVFVGLFTGLFSGLLYLLVRRWLPPGRASGLVFGAMLLILGGTRVEPLRGDNPDFDLVGPGWLSILVFAALALFHGMVLTAFAARFSRMLPLIGDGPLAIVALMPLLFYVLLLPVGLAVISVGIIAGVVTRYPPILAAWRSHNAMVVGWATLAVLVLIASPGFVSTVVDIFGRA